MSERARVSLRHRLEYSAYVVLAGLVRRLPLGLLQRVATTAAHFAWDRGGKRPHYATVNLRLAFPDLSDEERRRIGRESFVQFALTVIEFVRAEGWTDAELERRVEIKGLEHLERALARGRGVLGLTLHLGNFEVAVRRMSIAGFSVSAVGRTMRNSLIYERVVAHRTRAGGVLIDRDSAFLRMLRALRRNHCVLVLNDQYARRTQAVFVPLFGVRCSTSVGVAALALRTGSPVVPACIVREAPERHTIVLLPELTPPQTGDRERDIERLTAAGNEVLEQMIRAHPEQWMWGHRRFRYSPDLPEDPYGRRARRASG